MQISEEKMRPSTGENCELNTEGNRAALAINSPVGSRKNGSSGIKKKNSGKTIKKGIRKRNENSARKAGPTAIAIATNADKSGNQVENKEDNSIEEAAVPERLSSSTPRRKRAGLLANLRSDLSSKYIGFSTPSEGIKSLFVNSDDDSKSKSVFLTRSSRQRKLLNKTNSPEVIYSDSEVMAEGAATKLLGCVRRARNKEIVTGSLETLPMRKHFESPIEKLLARNGSTTALILNDMPQLDLVRNLNSSNQESYINSREECSFSSDTIEKMDVNISNDSTVDVRIKSEKNTDNNGENVLKGSMEEYTLSNKNNNNELEETCKHKHNNEVEEICKHKNEEQSSYIVSASSNSENAISLKSTESTFQFETKDHIVDEQSILELQPRIKVRSRDSLEGDTSIFVAIKKERDDNEESNSDNNTNSINNSLIDINSSLQLELTNRNDSSSLLNSAGVMNVKSPSALSLDSAKGSSVITGVSWMSFTTGDIFWGQIYSYCYWPCMVCPDPEGKTITTDRNVRRCEEHVLVHVRFFADNLRRNWVKKENLIPYTDLENYKVHLREVRKKNGRNSLKYKLMLPKKAKVKVWREAIKEANKVAEVLYSERLGKFFEIYEHKKALRKLQRKHRQSSAEMGSLPESIDSLIVKDQLVAIKRDRSSSPFSPAYSPLKPIDDIKRRKISETVEDELEFVPMIEQDGLQALAEISGQPISPFQTELAMSTSNAIKNIGLVKAVDAAVNTSSTSFTALHEIEMTSNNEYKMFFMAMKDFVLESSQDENLERSLVVASRNIWALKQINRRQMERRLLATFNENQLGSSLVESSRGDVKRLSNRLKNIMMRRSLNTLQTSVMTPELREAENESNREIIPNDTKPKRPINRPIEEVIEDIFNLDKKYLFKGMGRDPVCKYCFESSGQLLKCSRGCQSWLHINCIGKANSNNASNKHKRSRRRTKSINNHLGRENTEIEDNNVNKNKLLDNVEDANLIGTHSYHITADLDKEDIASANIPEVTCQECDLNKPATCSVCNKSSEATKEDLIMCNTPQCFKSFHPSCCKYWPQAKFTKSKNKIESFRCPSHVCHTCVSDDPKGKFQHLSNSKLTKCVKCPSTYHTDSTCIPAGSQVLTAAYIICPRHSASMKTDAHVNVSWCFICVGGGQVICCETCPTAVHAECLNIPLDPNEGYICEECESGRLPLYGEMVWAKFNSFRWWPALILPPTEVPQNIMRKSHNPNEFVVRFFGTHDHGWISRRRVYLYLEGDCSEPPKSKSHLDISYNRGIDEAKKIYDIIKMKRLKQNLLNEVKVKLHPQPYVRIKANRAVHPVKLHVDMEKVNKCECNPDAEDPCGPNSNCLNRVLYHECNPKICPAGERCQNQMFESKVSPRLDVVYMKERGFGLVSREFICAGTFIIEYVGEIINDKEFQQRMCQKSSDRDENFYFLSVEKDYIIDAGPKGNLARFMNHSCEPNCETQKWSVNGLNRIGLFAIKDIPENTELTFNYHWDDLLGAEKKNCFCGASKCAGQIGAKYREEKSSKDLVEIENVKEKVKKRRSKSQKKQTAVNKNQDITLKIPKVSKKHTKFEKALVIRDDTTAIEVSEKDKTQAADIIANNSAGDKFNTV